MNMTVDAFLPVIRLLDELVAMWFWLSPLDVIKDFIEKN